MNRLNVAKAAVFKFSSIFNLIFFSAVVLPLVELLITVIWYILREISLAIYFGDSQFRINGTFNYIVSKIYVDKRSRVQ